MVTFKDIYISDYGKELVVSASIDNLEYYDNMYISSVIIDTQDTFIHSGPSSNPVYRIDYPTIYEQYTEDELRDLAGIDLSRYNTKTIDLRLDVKDFLGKVSDLSSNIFFVYVIVEGVPSPNTPCGGDNKNHLGVAYYKNHILSPIISTIGELNNECKSPSKQLIDNILKYKAFDVSIRLGAFDNAIKYWKKFFKVPYNRNTSTCGCNGNK